MTVPFTDLKAQYLELKTEIDRAIEDIIEDTAFIGGPPVKEFEEALAAYYDAPHAIGVSNCTAALEIILRHLRLEPGDEIICPAHTYAATAESIVLAGGHPVFADIDEQTYQIDADSIAGRITPRTRAIVVVHLYGLAADMDAILTVANEHGVPVIEDCAQAQGTLLDGRHVGTFGLGACLSFFPSKNLGAFGDAGAIVTSNADLERFARMFANHGRLAKFSHEFPGANERIDALQAAILKVKLSKLDEWNARKREAAAWYEEELGGVEALRLPRAIEGCEPSWHLYVVRAESREDRDRLRDRLRRSGIQTGLHYPETLPELPAFAELNGRPAAACPKTRAACDTVLSLPMFPHITREQVAEVGTVVRDYYKTN